MGRPGSHPQFDQSSTIPGADRSSSTSINHFSHPHPLQLSILQPQRGSNYHSCAGCKNKASGLVYNCTLCNYFLHQKCSEMPQQITHPFDKDHVFDLLPRPCYAEGFFNCDACGKPGQGFCYHCKICFTDLHILCAALPMNINHQSHHHLLKLIFSPRFPNGTFLCDICDAVVLNHWLYTCDMCDFDAHLECTKNVAVKIQRNMHQSQTTSDLDQMHKRHLSRFSSYPTKPMAGSSFWQRLNNDNLIGNYSTEHGPIQRPKHIISGGGKVVSEDDLGGLRDLFQGLSVSNGEQSTSPSSASSGNGSGLHDLQNLTIYDPNQVQMVSEYSVSEDSVSEVSISEDSIFEHSTYTHQQFRPYYPSICVLSRCPTPNNDNLIGNSSTERGPVQQRMSDVISGRGEVVSGDDLGGLQDLSQGLSVSIGRQNTSPPSAGGADGIELHNLQNFMGAAGTGNVYGFDVFGGLSMLDGVDMGGLLGGLLGAFARRISRRITRRITRRIIRRITRRRTRRVTRRIIRRITRGITRKITWL